MPQSSLSPPMAVPMGAVPLSPVPAVVPSLVPNVPVASPIISAPSMPMPMVMPPVAKIGDGLVAIFNSRAMSFFLLTISIIIIMTMLKGFIFNVASLFGSAFMDTWNYTINSIQKNII